MTIAEDRTRRHATRTSPAGDDRPIGDTAFERWRQQTLGEYTPAQRVRLKPIVDAVFGADD
ncbi:hypothetical protein ACFVAJ_17695 [Agromyces sp. NPDC057679]|uniref:hypothetical protein n=1 Tax=Agromyces sp. NPDC057679 TaxID=3346207 RepID=UPI00366A7F2B